MSTSLTERVRGAIRDPRHLQIAVLTALLGYGTWALDFGVRPAHVVLVLAAALATQGLHTPSGRSFDPRSPLISGLSLCLLLRANDPLLLAFAAVIAIASKFWIRVGEKHVFNPTTLALVATVYGTGQAWISPGQWGSPALAGAALVLAGGLVLRRAQRADVTLAFLLFWSALLFGRSAWLGEPWSIPIHRLQSGGLLLFAFFMLSDPRTTPDSRLGRILFAGLVTAVAGTIQFGLHRPHGLFLGLVACAPLVPLFDRFVPGVRFGWPGLTQETSMQTRQPTLASPESAWRSRAAAAAAALMGAALLLGATRADAFCGFYVARADTSLFNEASQVVLARDGDRTVLTMASDYRGEPSEFALVIPVPTFIERGQIHVAEPALVAHLDAYSAPRLVEYHDPDPCAPIQYMMEGAAKSGTRPEMARRRDAALGVTVEAEYTVGEYDILILAAEESEGLVTWLVRNGYRIPNGAERVVGGYLEQGMRFFVAKVNLAERAKLGVERLRPIQVAYESAKFMLPIRLGMVNADGPQELFIYTLTRKGRVETTNYRTVRLPTGDELPVYVKDEFSDFYRAMFDRQVEREDMRAVFLEYAWDMAWCDPCAADPLSPDQLRELGAGWVDDSGGPARDVFLTRLHLRYDALHFPEDLTFQETSDRQNFQGRYVLRHAFTGEATCEAATGYRRGLAERRDREVDTLARLTGWDVDEIRDRAQIPAAATGDEADPTSWWERLWP